MWSHLLVSLICIAGVQSRMCGTRSPTQELVQFHKRYNAMNIGGYIEPQTPFEVDTWFHYIFPGPLNFMDKFRSEWHTKDQIRVLNENYAPAYISFKNDGQITLNPSKNDWTFKGDDLDRYRERAMKSALRKGSYSTMNVYVVPALLDEYGEFAGEATFPKDNPTDGQKKMDGIKLLAAALPRGESEYNSEGKVLVHEAGHWLSLFHLWHSDFDGPDELNENGTCIPNGGDAVDDTPQQSGPSLVPYGCALEKDSCPDIPGLDMWWNHMDYGWDKCRISFTNGQINNMHRSWDKQRKGK